MGINRINIRWVPSVSAAVFALCSYSALGAAPAASSADSSASGSDSLEEVVITAERRSEDVQKTALAVTVITPDKIEKTGVTTFDTLLENIPGVQVQAPQGPGSIVPYIAIRGLGTDGDNKPGATQLYLDGILTGAMGAELYDLQRVEVLRGPQGTLYGGSATGGAVNILSNDPNFNGYSGSAQAEFGDYGLLHEVGVVNAPLTDALALRAAVNSTRRDSYADKTDPFGAQTNGRIKLLYKPNDAVSVLIGGEFWSLTGVTGDGFGTLDSNGKPDKSSYAPVTGTGGYEGYRVYANMNFDLGFAHLVDITSVEKTHDNPGTLSAANGAGYTDQPHKDTFTEELRLRSNDSSKIQWVLGFWDKYYYQRDQVNIEFPPPGAPSVLPVSLATNQGIAVPEANQWQQYAGFGQAVVPLGDSTRLTGGLRYSSDQIKFTQNFTWEPAAPPFLNCGPLVAGGANVTSPCTVFSEYAKNTSRSDFMLRLEQDLTPQNMLYAMASTGYRPGGLSAPATAYLQPRATYATESVHAYELGSKNRFLNNRLQVNGDIYYNRYPAFQNEITNISGFAHIPSIVTIPATFYGAELEVAAVMNQTNRITTSLSYIHAQYTANGAWTNPFNPAAGNFTLTTDSGTVPHAPKFQGNIDYTNTVPFENGGNFVTDLQMHYQTSQSTTFDPCLYGASSDACQSEFAGPGVSAAQQAADATTFHNGLIQSAYALFNLSFSYSSPNDKFTATLYCRNCTNEWIKTGSSGNGYYSFGPPLTFGVVLGVKF